MGPKDTMRIAMILPPRADDSIYTVSIIDIFSSFVPSASIPFSGNALGFITFNSQPFIVTYSLKAVLDKPTMNQ